MRLGGNDNSIREFTSKWLSPIIILIFFFSFTEICKKETISTNKGIFVWPRTKAGSNATIACPHDASAEATRLCKAKNRKTSWKKADIKDCPKLKENSRKIFDLTEVIISVWG